MQPCDHVCLGRGAQAVRIDAGVLDDATGQLGALFVVLHLLGGEWRGLEERSVARVTVRDQCGCRWGSSSRLHP